MKVLFRCGHDGKVREGAEPICACGQRGIARVLDAPNPRIVGRASGPLVETKDLDPAIVTLHSEGPLKLKEQRHDE